VDALLAEAVDVSISGFGELLEREADGSDSTGVASPRGGHLLEHEVGRTLPRLTRADQSMESIAASGFTTLMIRNLPHNIVQGDLVCELDRSGFQDLYDFLYMPSVFHSGRGKGYAFVNFVCPSIACIFMGSWHKSHRFSMAKNKKTLDISVACVQGREANVLKWDDSKRRRVLNPNYRPVIRPGLATPPEPGTARPVLDLTQRIAPPAGRVVTQEDRWDHLRPQGRRPAAWP